MTSPNVSHAEPDTAVIRDLARADFTVMSYDWPFAQQRRRDIDAYFAKLKADKPTLWNGRVLLFCAPAIAGMEMTGEAFDTDYASFCAWHAWGRPDAGARNVFAAAAVESSDGGFLLGVMGPHTTNAGHVYFPCGTPEPEDVINGRVDLDGSAQRELLEETGLDAAGLDIVPGWTVVLLGPFVALFKRMRARESADVLAARVRDFLATQAQPELSDVVIVRGRADLSPQMPPFITAFLGHVFSFGPAS